MRLRSLAVLVAVSLPISAQDMPLSQILLDGKTWERAPDKSPASADSSNGYALDPLKKTVSKNGKTYPLPEGIVEPNGLFYRTDRGALVVADAGGKFLWEFRIEADGALGPGDRYYALRVRKEKTRSEASVMTFDAAKRLYVWTEEGVQVFDPTGRLCGVLTKPPIAKVVGMNLFGDQLYVTSGSETFVRTLLAKAAP